MSKFCGGINLGTGLKVINGIICDSASTTVDKTKVVTTCGQLWDGSLFTKVSVDGIPVITLHNSEGEDVGQPVKACGNCGVGLDGRFFKIVDGKVNLQDGFLLTVVAIPDTATITVMDADSGEVEPVEGNANVFLLSGIGDKYSVTVQKDGYTGKSQTITNDSDQTITIELEEEPQG